MNANDAVKAIVDVIDLCKELQVKLLAVQMERDELDAEVSDYRDSTRWIPVSENLPEDDIEVLVFDGLDIFLAIRSDGAWYADGHAVDVEAWQLLPDPPTGVA